MAEAKAALPKVIWVRPCVTAGSPRYHLAFESGTAALEDCELGRKNGCKGARGRCDGAVKFVRSK